MRRGGKVYLIGAGPGDPELITIKGARILSMADAVVYDRLVDRRLLKLARGDALLVYAGKAPGSHSMTQDEINRALLELAGRYELVVRLKGGDPLIFGRGEEECLYLLSRGVECEVIPGITSYQGASSQYLIPLAGRGFSSNFTVATGTRAGGSLLGSQEIERLVSSSDTIVFLMATKIFPEIVRATVKVRGPSTPIAVVERATTLSSTIRLASADDPEWESYAISSPAVIYVGGGPSWALKNKIARYYS